MKRIILFIMIISECAVFGQSSIKTHNYLLTNDANSNFHAKKIDRIVIKYLPDVDFTYNIQCDDDMFVDSNIRQKPTPEFIVGKVILAKKSYKYHNVDSLYSYFHEDSESYSICVRFRIENYDDQNSIIDVICMDNFGVCHLMSNRKLFINEPLRRYLIDMTDDDMYNKGFRPNQMYIDGKKTKGRNYKPSKK